MSAPSVPKTEGGARLMRLRMHRRLTRDEFAVEAGIARKTVFNMEVQGAEPTDKTLFKLADYYGFDPMDLLQHLQGGALPAKQTSPPAPPRGKVIW